MEIIVAYQNITPIRNCKSDQQEMTLIWKVDCSTTVGLNYDKYAGKYKSLLYILYSMKMAKNIYNTITYRSLDQTVKFSKAYY